MFDPLDPDTPTPEQRTAFDNLVAAMSAYHQAYDDPGLMMDWALVCQLTDPQIDGTDAHRTSVIGADGQPLYRQLGLLEYGATVTRRQINDSIF